jgi:hypothetical protein
MTCLSCQSAKQAELFAEILIHFPGLKNIDKPAVWLFPRLLVCSDCGASQFRVPEQQLAMIEIVTVAEVAATREPENRICPKPRAR